MRRAERHDRPRRAGGLSVRGAGIALTTVALLNAPAARGALLSEPGSDLKLQLDTTVQYSQAFRLKNRLQTLIADPNQDDGDRNFNRGLISNRLDALSEFDLRYKDTAGLRVSGAGWYDSVYHGTNDNNSPTTANNVSVPYNEFNKHTRLLHGGDAEILDALVFANERIGSMPATIRLGRHSLLYGESLFFGNNGIAGGQSPIDAIKLLSVPNSQFKEIIRPVEQASAQLQVLTNLAIGGYYQFQWHPTRIPSEGSYFSTADVLEGGERFLFGPVNPVTRLGPAANRDRDLRPENSGQGGVQARWRPEGHDLELGLYAIRYHDKTPQAYLFPLEGRYQLVYPEGIRAYGTSFSTQIGDANVAGEASVRRNTPLVSDVSIIGVNLPAGTTGDNNGKPLYAVGNSAHAQLSSIYLAPPTALWATASFLGEVAWNRRTSITRNPNALAANSSRDAWAMRFIFESTWYQVAPALDLSAPIGLGYSSHGNSSVVGLFNPGGRSGGDLSVGVKAVYKQNWHFGVNYTHYFGSAGTVLNSLGQYTFKQSLADRDFVSLSAQTSF